MAYVRRKQVKGRTYYQFVEAYRDGGKPRQRVIAHLGQYPTVEEALAGLPDDIERWHNIADKWRRHAERVASKHRRRSERYLQFARARAVAADERAEGLQARLHKLRAVVTNNVPAQGQT